VHSSGCEHTYTAAARLQVLAVGGEVPHFEKPAQWTAPYSPYTPGWWEVFYPGGKP
jgi:hypothetical protein